MEIHPTILAAIPSEEYESRNIFIHPAILNGEIVTDDESTAAASGLSNTNHEPFSMEPPALKNETLDSFGTMDADDLPLFSSDYDEMDMTNHRSSSWLIPEGTFHRDVHLYHPVGLPPTPPDESHRQATPETRSATSQIRQQQTRTSSTALSHASSHLTDGTRSISEGSSHDGVPTVVSLQSSIRGWMARVRHHERCQADLRQAFSPFEPRLQALVRRNLAYYMRTNQRVTKALLDWFPNKPWAPRRHRRHRPDFQIWQDDTSKAEETLEATSGTISRETSDHPPSRAWSLRERTNLQFMNAEGGPAHGWTYVMVNEDWEEVDDDGDCIAFVHPGTGHRKGLPEDEVEDLDDVNGQRERDAIAAGVAWDEQDLVS